MLILIQRYFYSFQLKDHSPNTALAATWKPHKKGHPYPTGMCFAGVDDDGYPIGIARFRVRGNFIPGVLNIHNCLVEVSYDHTSHKETDNFEILCDGDLEWMELEKAKPNPQSVKAGNIGSCFPNPIFVGKVIYNEKLVVGRVYPNSGSIYIPWDGTEVKVDDKCFHLIDKNIQTNIKSEEDPNRLYVEVL